jgi:NAD(P)-dependent dehydrogenase (short-subunit alcohol dehydrogenase family)
LLEKDSSQVIALTRNPNSNGLLQLKSSFPHNLTILETDICNEESITATANIINSLMPRIDLLINTSGVLGNGTSDPGPERKAQDINAKWLADSFKVPFYSHFRLSDSPFLTLPI